MVESPYQISDRQTNKRVLPYVCSFRAYRANNAQKRAPRLSAAKDFLIVVYVAR
jgi:hypothetical protein